MYKQPFTVFLSVFLLSGIGLTMGNVLYSQAETVEICHEPDSDTPTTMTIPAEDLQTYLDAGDLLDSCESYGFPLSSSSSAPPPCDPVACPLVLPEGCTAGPPTIVDGCQIACGELICTESSSSSESPPSSSSASSTPAPTLDIEEIRDNIEASRDLRTIYTGKKTAAVAGVLHTLLLFYDLDHNTPYQRSYTYSHESIRPAAFETRKERVQWIDKAHDLCCSLYRYIVRLQELHPDFKESQIEWLAQQLSVILGEDIREVRDALHGQPHDHDHTHPFLKSITQDACTE